MDESLVAIGDDGLGERETDREQLLVELAVAFIA
jgi:hypothetical protein